MSKLTVVITGSSSGIGKSLVEMLMTGLIPTAEYEIDIHGIDIAESPVDVDGANPNGKLVRYFHHNKDVSEATELPDIDKVNILINSAGIQEGDNFSVIRTNLIGVINCVEKYAINNEYIKSVVNMASVSAWNGAEFPEYCASKGGVVSYTINTAKRLAPRAICNSISFGGVITPLTQPVVEDVDKWNQIMDLTPMRKWLTSEEAAEWTWFVAYTNKSMTGQDVLIDNGEMINHTFVW